MNNSLSSFLESLQLQQYHETFIKAGATDQDLPQLIQFNEQELTEFLSAVNMLPFHSIKFKKAIRELKVFLEQQKETNSSIEITATSINKHAVKYYIHLILIYIYIYKLTWFIASLLRLQPVNSLNRMLLSMVKRRIDR
jgi:hypothetical protein